MIAGGLRRLSVRHSRIALPRTLTTATTPVSKNQEEPNSKFWKYHKNGRHQRPIFVAATRQHVGKTTVSLALLSGLQKRYEKVGFVKPGK